MVHASPRCFHKRACSLGVGPHGQRHRRSCRLVSRRPGDGGAPDQPPSPLQPIAYDLSLSHGAPGPGWFCVRAGQALREAVRFFVSSPDGAAVWTEQWRLMLPTPAADSPPLASRSSTLTKVLVIHRVLTLVPVPCWLARSVRGCCRVLLSPLPTLPVVCRRLV